MAGVPFPATGGTKGADVQAEASQQRLQEAERAVRALQEFDYPPGAALKAECDMVMKGGITSGVVYPLAVCELAKRYRFRSLGGASAGAIAAAAAAAAEVGRESGGYQRLALLPTELGDRLQSLFQPSARTRPLFQVLLAAIDPKRTGARRVVGVATAMVRHRFRGFVVGAGIILLLGWLAMLAAAGVPSDGGEWGWFALGTVALLIPAVVAGVLGAGVSLALNARRTLQDNGYGICCGSDGPGAGGPRPPLTDWLTTTFDELAGLDPGAGPLTFGDLWGAKAVDQWREDESWDLKWRSDRRSLRRINLEAMTTNVTHGRPTRLPFESRDHYFCEAELRSLFPPSVMQRLVAGGPVVDDPDRPPRVCPSHHQQLYRMPEPPDLPVVVAVRMSLSFPGLISAVPLFKLDYREGGDETGAPVRCWFSDGGISSNFPIHFFDGLFPGRPTFGINLAPSKTDPLTDEVAYEPSGKYGRNPLVRDTSTLTGFLAAILDTMQNWSDEGQATLPGYRERIVDILHTKKEGGINLSMPRERILVLAHRGALAAEKLAGFDFAQHRWTRYRTAMSELQQALIGMWERYHRPLADGAPGYRRFLTESGRIELYDWEAALRAGAVTRTDQLLDFIGVAPPDGDIAPPSQADPNFVDDAPRPDPDLRITPRF
jgi:predicted acylesterase/phospholipase RssA